MGKIITKKNIPLFISLASFILSIFSVGYSVYIGNENLSLEKENYRLTNFTPSIESSYSSSEIETSNYMRNESFAIFSGKVNINLMVLASQYSKLVVYLKFLNYSDCDYDWVDLEEQKAESYSNEIVYEKFIERGFNPISAEFILSPMIDVRANFINSETSGFAFKLGNVTLEAKLIDLVTNQTVLTQEFDEGIFIRVKEII